MGTEATAIIGAAKVGGTAGADIVSVGGGLARDRAYSIPDSILPIIIILIIIRIWGPTPLPSSRNDLLPQPAGKHPLRRNIGITVPDARPITLTLLPAPVDGGKYLQLLPTSPRVNDDPDSFRRCPGNPDKARSHSYPFAPLRSFRFSMGRNCHLGSFTI